MLIVVIYIIPEGRAAGSFRFLNLHHYIIWVIWVLPAELKKQIVRYVRARKIYEAYRTSGYSKRYFEEHRDELSLHKAAKKYFNRKGLRKFPSMKDLSFEYGQILKEKQALYVDFHAAKKEMMAYRIVKHNIDLVLQQWNMDKTKRREKGQNLGRR